MALAKPEERRKCFEVTRSVSPSQKFILHEPRPLYRGAATHHCYASRKCDFLDNTDT